MPDPIMMAAATALAVKSAEAVVAGGRTALSTLAHLVRERFAADPAALRNLDDADLADAESVQALAGSLDRVAAGDPAFETQVRALWAEIDASPVVNHSSGDVSGVLLQGRDFTFNGGLHLSGPAEPR